MQTDPFRPSGADEGPVRADSGPVVLRGVEVLADHGRVGVHQRRLRASRVRQLEEQLVLVQCELRGDDPEEGGAERSRSGVGVSVHLGCLLESVVFIWGGEALFELILSIKSFFKGHTSFKRSLNTCPTNTAFTKDESSTPFCTCPTLHTLSPFLHKRTTAQTQSPQPTTRKESSTPCCSSSPPPSSARRTRPRSPSRASPASC